MKRIVLALVTVLALPLVASADKVILKSGWSYDVRGFEITPTAIKMVTVEGRAWAVVLTLVDVPATLKANGMSTGSSASPGWGSAQSTVTPAPENEKSVPKDRDKESKEERGEKTRAEKRAEREERRAEARRARESEKQARESEKQARESEPTRHTKEAKPNQSNASAVAEESSLTKYVVLANVGYNGSALNFGSSFANNNATLQSIYTGNNGGVLEVGGVYRWRSPWAAVGTAEFLGGNTILALNTTIVNPVNNNTPVVVQTTVPALAYRETAVNLGVSYSYVFRPQIVFEGFGGPTLFQERVTLLSSAAVSIGVGPNPTGTVATVTATLATDTALGFNLGGGVSYRWKPWLGAGFTLRYNRATANVVDGLGTPISFTVGGVHANGGIRLFFK